MAAITIKNISQLDKILDAKIRTALENTRKMIGSSIQKTVSDFYHENDPANLKKQVDFFNSLISTEVRKKGNSYCCEVKIDSSFLNDLYSDPDILKPAAYPAAHNTVLRSKDESGLGYDGGNIHINDGGIHVLPDLVIQDLGDEAGITALLKENLARTGLIL